MVRGPQRTLLPGVGIACAVLAGMLVAATFSAGLVGFDFSGGEPPSASSDSLRIEARAARPAPRRRVRRVVAPTRARVPSAAARSRDTTTAAVKLAAPLAGRRVPAGARPAPEPPRPPATTAPAAPPAAAKPAAPVTAPLAAGVNDTTDRTAAALRTLTHDLGAGVAPLSPELGGVVAHTGDALGDVVEGTGNLLGRVLGRPATAR